jgi:cell fate (sporulation/competence/biofilm development) regulator YlbF (YheA/YmcA/DUF963 family)
MIVKLTFGQETKWKCSEGSEPYRRFTTVQEVQNYKGGSELYRRFRTVQKVQNCTGGLEQYRRFRTVQEVQNCTGGSELYRRFRTVQKVQNCTKGSESSFNNTINYDGSQADIPNYERNRNLFSTSRA